MKKSVITIILLASVNLYGMDLDDWEQQYDLMRAPVPQNVPVNTNYNFDSLETNVMGSPVAMPVPPAIYLEDLELQQPVVQAPVLTAQTEQQQKQKAAAFSSSSSAQSMQITDSYVASEKSSDEDYVDEDERKTAKKNRNAARLKAAVKVANILKDKVAESVTQNTASSANEVITELVNQVKSGNEFVDYKYKSLSCTWPNCSKKYARKHSLRAHIQKVHENNNQANQVKKYSKAYQFECTWLGCPKKFTQAQARSRHIRNVHEKVAVARCEPCNHDFYQISHLKSHLQSDKSFTCKTCSEVLHHSLYESHIATHKK